MASTKTQSEALSEQECLKKTLKLRKVCEVKFVENSAIGDGYMGNIKFLLVSGISKDASSKNKVYNIVLKKTPQHKRLRKIAPVKSTFLNESLWYEEVWPSLDQFQQERNVKTPLKFTPRYFGVDLKQEVLVLENLKSIGYELWPSKQPLTKNHVDLVVKEYGKFHATSAAFELQEPEIFRNLVAKHKDVLPEFNKGCEKLYGKLVELSGKLLQDTFDEESLQKWKNFKLKIRSAINDVLSENVSGLKVFSHGDCWSNNFMYKGNTSLKVTFLDWQQLRYSTPVADLSHFLFCTAPKEVLQNLGKVLDTYHNSFVNQLTLLGVNQPRVLYPYEEFFGDWKKYAKYGVLMSCLGMKIVASDQDELPDVEEESEKVDCFAEIFLYDFQNEHYYKERMEPIVEYAVKNDIV